ncbi:MAG: hypothetical protein HN742_26415 [Lentisphaerae bacterium]|jgi:hypothetical protein|nr:hypothetical protein [Lentisphaerota bacterium]MBT4817921.1 hypothetical protein [Lentisphaerota bacterium]MBT5605997.1 hypothetical protein [Lentisphaerota bacterium]MBT7058614.1 hypothetical protein [Lentisphaerota bacterium]MBT7845436.1 hypothetical protein [Lentisphaerota bacterium]
MGRETEKVRRAMEATAQGNDEGTQFFYDEENRRLRVEPPGSAESDSGMKITADDLIVGGTTD